MQSTFTEISVFRDQVLELVQNDGSVARDIGPRRCFMGSCPQGSAVPALKCCYAAHVLHLGSSCLLKLII